MQGDDDADAGDEAHYFFFSAPASPVHYILRSPPSTTAASSPHAAAAPADYGDYCCGDFEFGAAGHGGPAGGGGGFAMSSAEDLFVAGRIRVGCLSPIRQGEATATEAPRRHEEEEERERDERSPRARRARSASPPRSPRGAAEPSSDPFAPASASAASSSSSSSSSAKSIRRRISLRDLLARTGGDCAGADHQAAPSSGAEVTGRLGFWPPYIWPSRSSKKPPPSPCPAPHPGRRSTSSERAAKRTPGARRTTSLPYRQGLVLGCLGFGARSYGLARSMHPLSSR